ncbi:MAG: hypothetical protein ABIY35_05430 [Chitinophagaceae bacterium]
MKKTLIITSIIAASSAAFIYILTRRRKRNQRIPAPVAKTHHLTNVFAKAKAHIL